MYKAWVTDIPTSSYTPTTGKPADPCSESRPASKVASHIVIRKIIWPSSRSAVKICQMYSNVTMSVTNLYKSIQISKLCCAVWSIFQHPYAAVHLSSLTMARARLAGSSDLKMPLPTSDAVVDFQKPPSFQNAFHLLDSPWSFFCIPAILENCLERNFESSGFNSCENDLWLLRHRQRHHPHPAACLRSIYVNLRLQKSSKCVCFSLLHVVSCCNLFQWSYWISTRRPPIGLVHR